MTLEERTALLDKFLDKHNCKAKFYAHHKEYYESTRVIYGRMEIVIVDRPYNEVFTTAFSWSDTPEGCTFWSDCSNEWTTQFK